jgi:hypothetical protein
MVTLSDTQLTMPPPTTLRGTVSTSKGSTLLFYLRPQRLPPRGLFFGIAIVAIHHTRKMTADDLMETVNASFGTTGGAVAPRAVLDSQEPVAMSANGTKQTIQLRPHLSAFG